MRLAVTHMKPSGLFSPSQVNVVLYIDTYFSVILDLTDGSHDHLGQVLFIHCPVQNETVKQESLSYYQVLFVLCCCFLLSICWPNSCLVYVLPHFPYTDYSADHFLKGATI